MNILFVTGELLSNSSSAADGGSGLGRLVAGLGGALSTLGHRVVVVAPLRHREEVERYSLARRLSPLIVDVPRGGEATAVYVFAGKLPSGAEVRLLDHEALFRGRPAVTADADEPLRLGVLARAALRLAEAEPPERGDVHVVQGFGLPGALALYLAPQSPRLARARRVLTLERLDEQGRCDRSWVDRLGLPWDGFTPEGFEFYGDLCLLKAGLVAADRVVMSGLSAIADALTPEGGRGLEGVLKARRAAMAPLGPGLDYAHWNPATDVHLQAHYDAEQREGKRRNKTRLQQLVQLPVQTQTPLVALAPPLDDVAAALGAALPRLLRSELQLLAPASGLAPAAEAAVEEARERFPRLVARVEPGTARWHQVLAGADLLLLDAPRGFEAEPLLAALRYGAVPIVRDLGLARDLVVDLTNTLESGNGFLVRSADTAELVAVVRRAHAAVRSGQPWQDALGRLMSPGCSWEDAAQNLEMIYAETMKA